MSNRAFYVVFDQFEQEFQISIKASNKESAKKQFEERYNKDFDYPNIKEIKEYFIHNGLYAEERGAFYAKIT